MNKLILAADGSGDAQTIGEIKTLFKGDTEVFIKPGEYYVNYLADMCGTGVSRCFWTAIKPGTVTIKVIKCTLINALYETEFRGLIIMPSNNYSDDTRAIWYSNNQISVTWRNCLFLTNGINPTITWIYGHNNQGGWAANMNKKFYNCTFTSLPAHRYCVGTCCDFWYCAVDDQYYKDIVIGHPKNNGVRIDVCPYIGKLGTTSRGDYDIIEPREFDAGIYSGEFSWLGYHGMKNILKDNVLNVLKEKTKDVVVHYDYAETENI